MDRVRAFALVVGFMFAAVVPAFAVTAETQYSSFYGDGTAFFMRIVDERGARTGDSMMVFSPEDSDRSPWLYVHSFGIWPKEISGSWELVDGEAGGDLRDKWTLGQDTWLKIPGWDKAKSNQGLWKVDAEVDYLLFSYTPGGSVYFRVAPEPVSAGLFLLGGLGLLGGRAVRRRKTVVAG